MDNKNKYWFPAKSYGWGWGLPTAWQGWVILAAYATALGLIFYLLPPAANEILFSVAVLVSTVFFLAACWLKGEPPRWRWGGQ